MLSGVKCVLAQAQVFPCTISGSRDIMNPNDSLSRIILFTTQGGV